MTDQFLMCYVMTLCIHSNDGSTKKW